MSGRRPVGRNSLVTETKIAPARTRRPTQGKAGAGVVLFEDNGRIPFEEGGAE
jgi:hypothetical protein